MAKNINNCNKEDNEIHRKKFFIILKKLQEAGYRANEEKYEAFLIETIWLRHEVTEHGRKPNREKINAILQLKSPKSTEKTKSLLGGIQYIAKFLPNFSEKTNRMRQLLRTKSEKNRKNEKSRTSTK